VQELLGLAEGEGVWAPLEGEEVWAQLELQVEGRPSLVQELEMIVVVAVVVAVVVSPQRSPP